MSLFFFFLQLTTLLSHGFTIHCKGREELSQPSDKRQTTRERANEKMRAPETLCEWNTLQRRANCRLQNAQSTRRRGTWGTPPHGEYSNRWENSGRKMGANQGRWELVKECEGLKGLEGWRKWTSRKLRSFIHMKWAISSSAPSARLLISYKSQALACTYIHKCSLCSIISSHNNFLFYKALAL